MLMKTPENNDQLTRWLDGELTASERAAFEAEMQSNPALREEAEMMKRISETMRQSVPMEMPVPHGDFFNSQIMDRVYELQKSEERTAVQRTDSFTWLAWLRAPWAIAGAAALVAVTVLIWQTTGEAGRTEIVSLYAPNPGVQAKTSYNSEAEATVLMLEGLDTIPASTDIAGYQVHHSENDASLATTTLFNEKNEVLVVMATDAMNQPTLLTR